MEKHKCEITKKEYMDKYLTQVEPGVYILVYYYNIACYILQKHVDTYKEVKDIVNLLEEFNTVLKKYLYYMKKYSLYKGISIKEALKTFTQVEEIESIRQLKKSYKALDIKEHLLIMILTIMSLREKGIDSIKLKKKRLEDDFRFLEKEYLKDRFSVSYREYVKWYRF